MFIGTSKPVTPENSTYVQTKLGRVLVAQVAQLAGGIVYAVTTDPREGVRAYLGTVTETRSLPRPEAVARSSFSVTKADGTKDGSASSSLVVAVQGLAQELAS